MFSRHHPNVFISYRRSDSHAHAGRLADFLSSRLGKEHVFIDVDSIPAGREFFEFISDTMARTDVLVLVIGPSWQSATDGEGRRRLDDPADIVRRETEAALARGAKVVPVLVDGATMPEESALPESLKPIAAINAFSLPNRGWNIAATELATSLKRSTPSGRGGYVRGSSPALVGAAAVAIVVAIALGVAALLRSDGSGGNAAGLDAPRSTTTTPAVTIKIDLTELSRLGPHPVASVYIRQRPSISDTANFLPTGCGVGTAPACLRADPGDTRKALCLTTGPEWPRGSGRTHYARIWLDGFTDPGTGQKVGYVPETAFTASSAIAPCPD
jgi:TIR domain-containing protein